MKSPETSRCDASNDGGPIPWSSFELPDAFAFAPVAHTPGPTWRGASSPAAAAAASAPEIEPSFSFFGGW